jgi:hypothetical protein
MGKKLLSRVFAAGAMTALCAGALSVGTASAAALPACTDSWTNTAGGQWDTAANWSTGVPQASDTVCITTAGTYAVVVGNETITVANLTVGGAGGTPELQIGNAGSGLAHFTVSGTLTDAGTVSTGFGGTYSAAQLNNSGTFEVPASSFASSYSFGGVTNGGTFSAAGANTVSLADNATFDNSGTIDATGGTLALTSPTTKGTLQLDSGSTTNITSGGALTVADTTAVHGGSICGNALTVGSGDGGTGGTLAFATTPGTGPACGAGLATDQVFITNTNSTLSGTIPAAYTVTAGDGGSSFNNTTLAGNVVNQGTFVPGFGATVIGSGTTNELTNHGTILVPVSSFLSHLNTTLANTGTVTIDTSTNVSLAAGQAWTNGTKGTDGKLNLASGVTVTVSNPASDSSTFTQDGALNNLGTLNIADPVTIAGGTVCGNPLNLGSTDGGVGASLTFAAKLAKGPACAAKMTKDHLFAYNVATTLNSNIPVGWTLAVGDGGSGFAHLNSPGPLTNSGTFDPGFGATITVGGAFTNKGTLTVPASSFPSAINATSLTNAATMTVDAALTVGSDLINNKALVLSSAGALTVSGNYSQASKGGSFADKITPPAFGRMSVSGTASLAGAAKLTQTKAKKGQQFQIISGGTVAGTFATVTKTFAFTYAPTSVTVTFN